MDRILERLRQYRSATPSRWREEAQFRQANKNWLKQSREIAIRLLTFMRNKGMSKEELSNTTGLDEMYIMQLLRGKDKVTPETIKKLEDTLEISLSV